MHQTLREQRLRRLAKQQGLTLKKQRLTKMYKLIEGGAVGPKPIAYSLTIDEVERFLMSQKT